MSRDPRIDPDHRRGNVLSDFPPDQFGIWVSCDHCNHQVWLDRATVPEGVTVQSLLARLRCTAGGKKGASIRIIYVAAGGFRVSDHTPDGPT
jgi:hypothetical protein